MYETYYEKYKKEIATCVALLFSLLIIYAVVLMISRIGKVGVEFHLVPGDSTITINNKVYGNGTQYLSPGDYTAKITHEGFASSETSFIASSDKATVAVSLTPSSDEAKKWAEAHQSAYKDNERYGAVQARQDGRLFRERFPIVNRLPYEDPYYKIAYRSKNNRDLTITITTESPRYRYMAVQKIREFGFSPSEYKIDFVDYKNPLEATHE